MRKVILLFMLLCVYSYTVTAQSNKSRLSIQSSFFSETFIQGGSEVGMFYNNGVHFGVEYPFFNWVTSPKKNPTKFGSQEGFIRLNSIFYQLPSLSNNTIINGELGLRKTFHFGLFLESSFSIGSMNYSYLYPVYEVDDNNQVSEIPGYNYWEGFAAYSIGLGWDFEKNFNLPLSLYLRTLSYSRGGYIEYYKNSLFIGLNYRFNKAILPAYVINKSKKEVGNE